MPGGYQDEEELYDARSIARAQSAHILTKKNDEREEMKQRMESKRRLQSQKKSAKRTQDLHKMKRKTKSSAFKVDLVAENEKIDEENHIRMREETRRERQLTKQKEKVKNEIILKALSEVSDLEALRAEKRAIQMEEKRLKALLDLEKTNAHRKQDQEAAKRAEKQRKQAITQHSRSQRIKQNAEDDRVRRELLRVKLDVSNKREPFSF